jgi:hypothetical protein
MPADLLDRIFNEIRERKRAAQVAYHEAQQLEAALAALDTEQPRNAGQ